MHGIISRIRSVSAQRKLALKRKLTKERRGQFVRAVVAVMQGAEPTAFRFEGTCRHAVRSGLCLDGWTWREADAAAAEVVTLALVRLGARRPSWHEGQPEYTRIEGRTFCANEECQKPIVRESFQVLMYCSDGCRIRAKAKRAYRENAEERVAYAATRRAAKRQKAETRKCEWCSRPFQPLDYAGKKPQRFCGLPCRSRYARSTVKDRRPAKITTWRCE